MTRINTNVPSLVAQNRLQTSNQDLQQSLTRLSTGLRINSGSDDPAGLIASEALRSEITSLGKAVSNTRRASQIISTADSALGQVSSLLNDIRGLVVEAANNGALSDDEIAANQLQVDSSLEAINRIAQTTTFQGRRLLDGSLDFVTKAGGGFGTVADLKIDQANLGAVGAIDVDVKITSAATRASVTTSGIPSTATAVNSTGTLTFAAPSADTESSATLSFTNSYTVGAAASGDLIFDSSYVIDGQASVDEFVIGQTSGPADVTLDIAAIAGQAADGEVGNSTDIVVAAEAVASESSATYDETSNTLTLNLVAGDSSADILSDLQANGTGKDVFAFTAGAATGTVATVSAGTTADALGGGSHDASGSNGGFTLAAVKGGVADGLVGDSTTLNVTSGTTTSAAYDVDSNELNVTVADGATINDIAAAINSGAGDVFSAADVVNGGSFYDAADNETGFDFNTNGTGADIAVTNGVTGANDTLASSLVIEAINDGAADGAKGDDTTVDIVTGDTTGAVYDADTDKITVTVAEGASVQQIADQINGLDDFLVRNVQNGNALFDTTNDVGTDLGTFTGGADTTGNDVITVTADAATADADGTTISLQADNSLATGTAVASLDDDGNIVVDVSSLDNGVSVGAIAAAISDLDGFTAAVTETNGDGVYDIAGAEADTPTETAVVSAALANGQFGGGLNADLVVQLTGSLGSEVFQFDKGASLEDVIQSINLVSDSTGISAEDDGGNLKLNSTSYGNDSLVAVEVINEGEGGTFETSLSSSRAEGSDIVATVNGTSATGNGNTLSINTSTLDLTLTVEDGSNADINFNITGGGALFQLGPDVTSNQQARLGISSVNTGQLGGPSGRLYELASGQSKDLSEDVNGAAQVIDDVINKVTGLRGRLGAFQATTLESNLVSLAETSANLQEAESSIRDADFAQESAKLTRAQILVQSGTNVLGIANQNPQNVLSLLR